MAVALNIREDLYQVEVRCAQMRKPLAPLSWSLVTLVSIPKNKAVVGGNAFSHEVWGGSVLKNPPTYEIITPELVGVKSNSLPLGNCPGRLAFVEKLHELGLEFTEEDISH